MKNHRNPKALNLEAIRNLESKVTLGIKCKPELKIKLAEEAESSGLTLSNYVEQILISNKNLTEEANDNKILELININNGLVNKLKFYENDTLMNLFHRYNGQIVNYRNVGGTDNTIKINRIEDVYTVIVNSFK